MRRDISALIDHVRETGETIAIKRHNDIEALFIKFPTHYRKALSNITNINTNSNSFDWLDDEPDIYSIKDLKKSYV